MTKREMYEAIINGTITEDVIATAQAELEKLDATNAARAAKAAEKDAAKEPLRLEILAQLGDTPKTATEIASILNVGREEMLTVQGVSAQCRKLVKQGRANVEDVKIQGKGMQKGYTL